MSSWKSWGYRCYRLRRGIDSLFIMDLDSELRVVTHSLRNYACGAQFEVTLSQTSNRAAVCWIGPCSEVPLVCDGLKTGLNTKVWHRVDGKSGKWILFRRDLAKLRSMFGGNNQPFNTRFIDFWCWSRLSWSCSVAESVKILSLRLAANLPRKLTISGLS